MCIYFYSSSFCVMCSILPASLHCQFMIALLDFLNVYLLTTFCSLLILVTSVDVRYLAYVLLCSYSQRLKTFPIYLFEGTIWRYSRDDKDLKHFQYIYLRVPYESTPETSRAHHITYLHFIIARGSYYLFEPSGQIYIPQVQQISAIVPFCKQLY